MDKIDVGEVSRILGIGDDTLRKWEKEERLTSFVIGNKKFYKPEEVLRLSESSIKFMARSHTPDWLFDNFYGKLQSTTGGNHVFLVPESLAAKVSLGEISHNQLPFMGMSDNYAHVYHVQELDRSQYGRPQALYVVIHNRSLVNLDDDGCGGGWVDPDGRYRQDAWHYRINKDKIIRVYEELWKFPHKSWQTEWVYASVPDHLLESKETE